MAKSSSSRRREAASSNPNWRFLGFLLLPLFIFPLLSLFSFDWRDIGLLNAPPNNPANNLIGVVGAWGAFGSFLLFGLGAWLLPLWLLTFSLLMALGRTTRFWRRLGWVALIQVMACALLQLDRGLLSGIMERLNLSPNTGGYFGKLLMDQLLIRFVSRVGGSLIAIALLLLALLMAIGPRAVAEALVAAFERFRAWRLERADETKRLEHEQRKLERKLEREQKRAEREAAREVREAERAARSQAEEQRRAATLAAKEQQQRAFEERKEQLQREREAEAERLAAATQSAKAAQSAASAASAPPAEQLASSAEDLEEPPAPPPYQLPSIELLDPIPPGEAIHGDVEKKAELIVNTLAEFNMAVEVTHIEKGPVVTCFELLPAAGIRVERIASMAKNLEMVLKATSVRVEAPIPGKGVVGVETPNDKAVAVTVRELLEGPHWNESIGKMEIPLLLGKNISGRDLVVDLATIPHLLIAGATGSGKSVCINAILTGLLMSRTPDDLRLMLVDPKIVEFAIYNELPHLIAPVITDPKKVALGLRWAIQEMEKRYKMLHIAGVRNIASFNRRQSSTQLDMFEAEGKSEPNADASLPRKLPYIVIVIDELADLMLQAGPEIENCIARLAQLSRAVGIHLIIATQRPSVNVITGTIKANFPGRIAFQVAQRVDSRTILDSQGAESLIGRGDMLFLDPRTSKLMRGQGAFIADHDAKEVVDFIREQCKPVYIREVQERLDNAGSGDEDEDYGGGGGGGGGRGGEGNGGGASTRTGGGNIDDGGDEYLDQAIEIIRESRRASTSLLQRRLRIGYTRAARMMDMLEERGIVGPPRGADPRDILIDLDGEIPNNMQSQEGDALRDAEAE